MPSAFKPRYHGRSFLVQQMQRRVQIAVDARMSPDQIGKVVAEAASINLNTLIEQGAASTDYRVFVDGVADADPATVKLDGGKIEYIFNRMGEASAYALDYCQQFSPEGETGDYARAWIVVVDGVVWQGALTEIPNSALQIFITNPAPFAEKLELEAPSAAVTTGAASATAAAYKSLRITRQFVDIPSGGGSSVNSDWQVPYIRKRPPYGAVLYPAVVITRI